MGVETEINVRENAICSICSKSPTPGWVQIPGYDEEPCPGCNNIPGLGDFIQWTPVDISKPYKEPYRHYAGDAGFDLYCSEDLIIHPKAFANVPTNISIAMPEGIWCILMARSSTSRMGLLVTNGIIDGGWRSELFASVYNGTDSPIEVKVGDRLIQMVLFGQIVPPLVLVKKLPPGDRGNRGFGSTGK